MLKLSSLRSLLEQAVPELRRDPHRLLVMGDNGRIATTGTASLSFEYQYTAYVTVLDYTGHADALMVPVLAWLKINQPEATKDAVRFAINPVDGNAVDIGIELDLTERAIVKADPSHPTRLTITHPPEPGLVGLGSFDGEPVQQSEHWELWFDGKKLADWNLLPPDFAQAFGL